MKKFLGVLLSLIVLYAIYFDLTTGTLPQASSQKADAVIQTTKPKTTIPYFEAKVEPGETVLTIVEHQIKKPLPVSISKLIRDFQALNTGKDAEKIQIGQTYRFPDYTK
ncbi:hypothetical protein ACQYAD_16495 [Neobacillus sp. SM06]|uniref:hypothetical protein n=1 Tax=Neobacillus sp. SM06 TaxID=3422492 RepID=UPI003D2C2E15